MIAGKFINVHILHPLPFSNPNRDDTGAPKSLTYGGTTRSRLSSQSQKRAARQRFEGVSEADRTTRSKLAAQQIANLAADILAANGEPIDDALRENLAKAAEKPVKALTGKGDSAKDTLVWIAEKELRDAALALAGEHSTNRDLDIKDVLGRQTASLTIAGFGRMFANRPDLQIEAAVQVAHAFTTHAQQIDLDYFTAVDDLTASFDTDAGAGAGHLDIAEFTSGVFYRFISIDVDQLVANWDAAGDKNTALERLREWISAMVESLPTGKENVAAHHTLPAFVMVEFTDRPLSAAPAFERAVTAAKDTDGGHGGHTRPSVDRLIEYVEKVDRAYAQETKRVVFDLDGDSVSLADVYDKVAVRLADAVVT